MENQSRGYNKASQRTFEVMRHFAETYAKRTGTFFLLRPRNYDSGD
jgi:ferredoxin-thioredoxin reductase catalytic chain